MKNSTKKFKSTTMDEIDVDIDITESLKFLKGYLRKNFNLRGRVYMILIIAGAIIGALIGYTMTPTIPLIGEKLPLGAMLTRGASLEGLDSMLKGYAEQSFNTIFMWTIIGGILGFAVYKIIGNKKNTNKENLNEEIKRN